mgnify:CR=1 FL=1
MRNLKPTTFLALAAEDAAEDAAQDLPADLVADGAGGLLGHGLDHALAALGAEHGVLDRTAETAFLGIVVQVGQANPSLSGSAKGSFNASGGF